MRVGCARLHDAKSPASDRGGTILRGMHVVNGESGDGNLPWVGGSKSSIICFHLTP